MPHWQVDPAWLTRDTHTIGDVWDCHLFAADGGLLLVANPDSTLWRRESGQHWRKLGCLPAWGSSENAGNAACQSAGTVLTVTEYHGEKEGVGTTHGLCIREFAADGLKSKLQSFESCGNRPFHPSVAPLPGGRILVAFGTKDGLVATVLRKVEADDIQDGKSTGQVKGQE